MTHNLDGQMSNFLIEKDIIFKVSRKSKPWLLRFVCVLVVGYDWSIERQKTIRVIANKILIIDES